MTLLHHLSYFLAGAFFFNALPHLLRGLQGQPFQTPFAKPSGEGLSSSRTNFAWGFFNLVLAYLLLFRVGLFAFRSTTHVACFSLGGLLLGWMMAGHFGRFPRRQLPRSSMIPSAGGTFRSLRNYNYRLWAAGALVSNVGTWMQRTAQDWIVLTRLTHHNATAVGIVMALQFGPQVLFLPWTGFAADHLDRRKLLIATQSTMGALALGLGLLTVTGMVRLWQVYVFAGLLGCASAFDAPARQTFVSELVGEADLSNAVALNSTQFNAARMIGPAIAGVLIAAIGSGWVFILNAVSFVAVLASLSLMRVDQLHRSARAMRAPGSLAEGFRYVGRRPDLLVILLMISIVGTFGLNFPIFISTMSVTVFRAGASQYGLLSSLMAVGSVTGALLAAAREKPRMPFLLGGAALFGLGCGLGAMAPDFWLFGIALVLVGIAAQTFTTTVTSTVQLATEPAMRGRVMAILLAIAMGGTPIGAPIVGRVADVFGPRWALAIGAASGLVAAFIGIFYLVRFRHLRINTDAGHLGFAIEAPEPHPPTG